MPSPTYDIKRSYDENYVEGPFLEALPPPRIIQKTTRFLGFEVNSRLGVPAGPLLNARWIKAYAALGFDLLVYKTVRTRPVPSHPNPNCMFLALDGPLQEEDFGRQLRASLNPPSRPSRISITNSFGMPSRAPEVWQEDLEAAKQGLAPGQLLIVSVVGTPGEAALREDYVHGAKLAVEAGAPVIEINLSCPNVTSREGSIFSDPAASSEISAAVKRAIGAVPLIIKLGYIPDPDLLSAVISANAPHVEAVSSINTLSFEVVNAAGEAALPGKGRLRAGVCGAAIRECAMAQNRRIVGLKQQQGYDFEVVGVGGVMTTEHVRGYFEIGVDAVMSATGAMWDPSLAYRFWKEGSGQHA